MGLVSDRLLAAAFFIPKENQQQNQSIEVLLKKAGATNINRHEWLLDDIANGNIQPAEFKERLSILEKI